MKKNSKIGYLFRDNVLLFKVILDRDKSPPLAIKWQKTYFAIDLNSIHNYENNMSYRYNLMSYDNICLRPEAMDILAPK